MVITFGSPILQILSPPVQVAHWAHMHRFLSVCLSVCSLDWTKKGDTSERGRNMNSHQRPRSYEFTHIVSRLIFNSKALFRIILAPVSVNHAALHDTTLRGYNIPTSNCDVIANIYASHLDEAVFPQADVFRPSRFIDGNGEYQRHEAVIPFGLGKLSL